MSREAINQPIHVDYDETDPRSEATIRHINMEAPELFEINKPPINGHIDPQSLKIVRYQHSSIDGDGMRMPIEVTDTLGKDTTITGETRILPEIAIEQALQLISDWSKVFTKEDTWIQKQHGIPSLIVRVDTTIDEKGNLKPFEIEDRPAGIGIASKLNPAFKKRFDEIRKTWPKFKVIVAPSRKADDTLWTEVSEFQEVRNDLVFVRCEPNDLKYHSLENRSVSTLLREGDKSYGEKLGLWRRISNPNQLPWHEPFVLKPLQGTRSENVFVYLPNGHQRQFSTRESSSPGSTRSQIASKFVPEGMYLQPFHPPLDSGIDRADERWKWMIYRTFFGFDMKKQNWQHLGGLWNARGNLIVHGAENTLFGPAN